MACDFPESPPGIFFRQSGFRTDGLSPQYAVYIILLLFIYETVACRIKCSNPLSLEKVQWIDTGSTVPMCSQGVYV
ncbi:hypothetical protein SERLA73DRAFT_130756, partial [Serpula lacrymans var. lacrymans S7.3]